MSAQKANVIELSKNILGTLDISMKIGNMRKPQNFSVLPIDAKSDKIIIQSATRIGVVNKNGVGSVSKSYQNGAYFHHLSFGVMLPFEFEPNDWSQIKSQIGMTSPEGDSDVVGIENHGALQFALS